MPLKLLLELLKVRVPAPFWVTPPVLLMIPLKVVFPAPMTFNVPVQTTAPDKVRVCPEVVVSIVLVAVLEVIGLGDEAEVLVYWSLPPLSVIAVAVLFSPNG